MHTPDPDSDRKTSSIWRGRPAVVSEKGKSGPLSNKAPLQTGQKTRLSSETIIKGIKDFTRDWDVVLNEAKIPLPSKQQRTKREQKSTKTEQENQNKDQRKPI